MEMEYESILFWIFQIHSFPMQLWVFLGLVHSSVTVRLKRREDENFSSYFLFPTTETFESSWVLAVHELACDYHICKLNEENLVKKEIRSYQSTWGIWFTFWWEWKQQWNNLIKWLVILIFLADHHCYGLSRQVNMVFSLSWPSMLTSFSINKCGCLLLYSTVIEASFCCFAWFKIQKVIRLSNWV